MTILFQNPHPPTDLGNWFIVSVRENWTDSWSNVDWIPEMMTMNAGAQPSVATLRWRYGFGRPMKTFGGANIQREVSRSENYENNSGAVNSDAFLRYWVRIQTQGTQEFVGSVETIGDKLWGYGAVIPGSPRKMPTGEERFNCYDMKFQLQNHMIVSSEYESQLPPTSRQTCHRGLTFNLGGAGNRTSAKNGPTYIFVYDEPTGTYSFDKWSTRDIVEYLIEYQTPLNYQFVKTVPWVIDPDSLLKLPDWDAPEVYTHSRSTLDILDNLISPQRFLTWWVQYDSVNNQMVLYVETFAQADVDLGPDRDGNPRSIPANELQEDIVFHEFAGVEEALRISHGSDVIDQVIVQGARRTSTCTLNNYLDFTIAETWSAAEKQLYDAGASLWPTYPLATEKRERRMLNAFARVHDSVKHVYAEFTPPPFWDYKAGNGRGATQNPVFPDDDTPTSTVNQYRKDMRFLQMLMLRQGRDYRGDAIINKTFEPHDTLPSEHLAPLVLGLPPDQRPAVNSTAKWVDVSRIGPRADLSEIYDYADNDFSMRVRVMPDSWKIRLEVVGEQHLIAKDSFVPLPEDDAVVEWDWREWMMTVSMEEDRFCQSQYPDGPPPGTVPIPPADSLRRLVIQAGRAYRKDYVVPGTVVGVDEATGQPIRTNGGFVQNDTDTCRQVARAAHAWYSQARRSLQMRVPWTPDAWTAAKLGKMYTTINQNPLPPNTNGDYDDQQDLYSVVTSYTIDFIESTDPENVPPFMVTITSNFATVDPTVFVSAFE